MRELKFRAYIKDHWIYRSQKEGDSPMQYNWQDTGYVDSVGFNPDDIPIMQFTGLKDKNGVEIYEGDVVKYMNDNSTLYKDHKAERGEAIVQFGRNPCAGSKSNGDGTREISGYTFGWHLRLTNKSQKKLTGFMRGLDVSSMTVIGNIHENPELLNE